MTTIDFDDVRAVPINPARGLVVLLNRVPVWFVGLVSGRPIGAASSSVVYESDLMATGVS
jgi:hypothetical protein